MTVKELLSHLALEIAAGEEGLSHEINGGFTGDLLSMVVASAKDKDIWMTVQGNENAVAVAVMAGIAAIVLTEGIEPSEIMIQKANEYNMPILKTKLSSFEMSIEINKLLFN